MEALVCGDLHLKPGGKTHPIEAIPIPASTDFALVVGDLTHRDGPADIALAREFVEYVTDSVPLLYVPGNHDHMPMPEEVVDGIANATVSHRTTHSAEALTVVGWGCTERSLEPPMEVRTFTPLDPTDRPPGERRHAADAAAETLVDACAAVICDGRAVEAVATELGLPDDERAAFAAGIEAVTRDYETLTTLLQSHADVLLATHRSPYNTSYDRHHSVGDRDTERAGLHTGSLPIRLALREHDVFASVAGHSHTHGYDVGGGPAGQPHCLNLGFRGIASVTVAPAEGLFSYTIHDVQL